jgi:transposase InsO family protein
MSHKSDASSLLKSFFTFVHNQFNAHIKIFRSDNGSEFLSLQSFFITKGVEFQTSCVSTPQQNGVVERKHGHILRVARALLFQSNMPIHFWGECVITAVYLINRLPTRLLSSLTPFERLYGRPPTYDHLRVFGSLCYATIVKPVSKFAPCARRCVFLGFPKKLL